MQTLKTILTVISIVSFICIPVIGCGNEKEGKKSPNEGIKEKAVDVEVTHVKVMDVEHSIDAVGSFFPNDDITVSSEVTGTVKEICLDEGDHVKKGSVLLRIDDEKIRLKTMEARSMVKEAEVSLNKLMAWTRQERVKQIEANLEEARINFEKVANDYKRYKELYEDGIIDKSSFDSMEAMYEIAKKKELSAKEEYEIATSGPTKEEIALARARIERAKTALALAEKSLKDTKVLSPITGIVSNRIVSIGEYVTVGTNLFKVVQNDPLKLSFFIPERFAGEVKVGQKVEAKIRAFPKDIFAGAVYYISPESDETTRSIEVKAKIKNEQYRLKPGFFAGVRLITLIRRNAIVLDEEAVVMIAERPAVFVIRERKAKFYHIGIGRRFDGKVEVISDTLKADDIVVKEGHNNLADNALIKVEKNN
ncbi:MAG: efflux RND transporter periplasmic adaptor subunit [Thermodesulfobacteriota bacterium]|nr:efflux RND transporter periplasmic adaptor subunit [Thermodesulfobacteriota bacterium]